MTETEMITIAVALTPDHYKERAFRYIGKLLPSSLSKPRYTELLKAQAEQRLSVHENRPLNVFKVCQRAGEILGEEDFDATTVTDSPYEDDWLSTFENESCHKNSEEMQERFARILAGEIKKPGSFSIRTIKLLGQIDSDIASIFKTFCSGCISFDEPTGSGSIYKSFFPRFNPGIKSIFIEKYGIRLRMLDYLQEYLLLPTSATPSLMHLGFSTSLKKSLIGNEKPAPFLYAQNYYLLNSRQDSETPDSDFNMPGIQLSAVGQELINIIEPEEPPKQLTEDIKEFFENKQLELVEVELTDDKHWKTKH